MAEVVVSHTVAFGRTVAQRQVQFYTLSAYGWQRSPPLDSFWGSRATLDTAHLHFVYRQLDAAAVAQIAARSESLYHGLHALLGLDDRASAGLQTIEVVPAIVIRSIQPATGAIRLTSPRLLYSQPDQSHADVLYDALKRALVRHVMEEAQASISTGPQWDLMVSAIHSWLLATADAAPGEPPGSRGVALPADSMPTVRPRLSAFLICFACTTYYPGIGSSYQPATQTDTGPWLIDLLVAHYGPEVLPRLLQGFATCEDWGTLAPAVFGKSAAELEAEWQE